MFCGFLQEQVVELSNKLQQSERLCQQSTSALKTFQEAAAEREATSTEQQTQEVR